MWKLSTVGQRSRGLVSEPVLCVHVKSNYVRSFPSSCTFMLFPCQQHSMFPNSNLHFKGLVHLKWAVPATWLALHPTPNLHLAGGEPKTRLHILIVGWAQLDYAGGLVTRCLPMDTNPSPGSRDQSWYHWPGQDTPQWVHCFSTLHHSWSDCVPQNCLPMLALEYKE